MNHVSLINFHIFFALSMILLKNRILQRFTRENPGKWPNPNTQRYSEVQNEHWQKYHKLYITSGEYINRTSDFISVF